MSFKGYKNNPELIEYHKLKIGSLYFFNNFVITELNEGIHVDFDNFKEATRTILDYFGDKPFGFIGNRRNTYSIDLNDVRLFKKSFPNLKAYAVVSNSLFSKGVFDIENHFFETNTKKLNRKKFDTIDDAVVWVKNSLVVYR